MLKIYLNIDIKKIFEVLLILILTTKAFIKNAESAAIDFYPLRVFEDHKIKKSSSIDVFMGDSIDNKFLKLGKDIMIKKSELTYTLQNNKDIISNGYRDLYQKDNYELIPSYYNQIEGNQEFWSDFDINCQTSIGSVFNVLKNVLKDVNISERKFLAYRLLENNRFNNSKFNKKTKGSNYFFKVPSKNPIRIKESSVYDFSSYIFFKNKAADTLNEAYMFITELLNGSFFKEVLGFKIEDNLLYLTVKYDHNTLKVPYSSYQIIDSCIDKSLSACTIVFGFSPVFKIIYSKSKTNKKEKPDIYHIIVDNESKFKKIKNPEILDIIPEGIL